MNKRWAWVVSGVWTFSCQSTSSVSDDAAVQADMGSDAAEVPREESIVASDGAEIYVRRVGQKNAPTLVTINGGPGLSSHYMDSLEQLADQGLAVVFYDQRGLGRSSEPTTGFTIDEYLLDLDAVVTWIGADTIHLFGHSWGGLLALLYAVNYPQRVATLTLLGSMPPDSGSLAKGRASLQARISKLQDMGLIPAKLPKGFCEQTIAIAPAYFYDPLYALPDEFLKVDCDQSVAITTFSKLGEYDYRSDIMDITSRTLVLWGEGDGFGLSTNDATISALSGAKVTATTLHECGHFWQECPEEFFENLQSFLRLNN